MTDHLILKVVLLIFLFYGSLAVAIALDEIDQDLNEIENHQNIPVESVETECQMSPSAINAINSAVAESARYGNTNTEALDLIEQARQAARSPECDSVRAEILADKAVSLFGEEELPTDESPVASKSSKNKTSSTCLNVASETLGAPSGAGVGRDPFTFLIVLSTSAVATVTSLLCIPTAITEGSSSGEKTAYHKFQQYRFVAESTGYLVRDMARGSGEYLTAMAYLQGCRTEVHDRYTKLVQRNFSRIFPQSESSAETVILNLEKLVAQDRFLSSECHAIT